jgi:hypothetical protein
VKTVDSGQWLVASEEKTHPYLDPLPQERKWVRATPGVGQKRMMRLVGCQQPRQGRLDGTNGGESNQIKPLELKGLGVSGDWGAWHSRDATPPDLVKAKQTGLLASSGTRRRSSLPKMGVGRLRRQGRSRSVKASQTNFFRFDGI